LEVVKERNQVADDVEDGVGGGVGGHGRVAVTTEVGGQRAEAAGGERGHLVAPGEPELREAVDEEDRRPVGGAALGDVERNAVDIRGPVPHLGGGLNLHALLLCLTRYLLTVTCINTNYLNLLARSGSHVPYPYVHASITPCAYNKPAMATRSNTTTQAFSTKYFCHMLFLFIFIHASQQMLSSHFIQDFFSSERNGDPSYINKTSR